MPTEIKSQDDLMPGEFYEDAFYHPCLCLRFSYEDDEVEGISLIDGSVPRCASVRHGFVRKLTFEEVAHYRFFGPLDAEVDPERDWTTSVAHDERAERHRLDQSKNQ
jgi:hypothetical protein